MGIAQAVLCCTGHHRRLWWKAEGTNYALVFAEQLANESPCEEQWLQKVIIERRYATIRRLQYVIITSDRLCSYSPVPPLKFHTPTVETIDLFNGYSCCIGSLTAHWSWSVLLRFSADRSCQRQQAHGEYPAYSSFALASTTLTS